MRPLEFPTPMHGVAITPKKRGDEQRISEVLHRMIAEDPTLVRRARSLDERDGAARAGRSAPALGAGAHGEPVQARDRYAAAAHPVSRDDHRARRGLPPAQEADGRRRPVRRSVAARRAARARRGLRVRRPDQGRRRSRISSCPAVQKGVEQVLVDGRDRRVSRCRTCASIVLRRQASSRRLEGSRVRLRRASKAFLDAIEKARPIVLEPVVSVEVDLPRIEHRATSPATCRRAAARSPARAACSRASLAITGLAPLVELDGYSARLKSVTGGHGSWSMAAVALRAGAAQPAAAARRRIQEIAQARRRVAFAARDPVARMHAATGDARAGTIPCATGRAAPIVPGGMRRLQLRPMADAMGAPTANFTHHFLIAMPAMADPHFSHTLTYVCEHNEDGALGIVVNKPTDMTLSSLFEQIDVPLADAELRKRPVHFGGPVQVDRGFVLHRPLGNWQSTLADQTTTSGSRRRRTCSRRSRAARARGTCFVSLGYAGWSAGQLEQEIAQNAWLTVEADPDVLFDTPVEAPAAGRDAAPRHRLLAPVRRRRARVTRGARTRRARSHGARVRFRHAPDRSCGGQYRSLRIAHGR